jgi:hypothetical protein
MPRMAIILCRGAVEHCGLPQTTLLTDAIFFVPHRNLPAWAGNAEVGSDEGQDGKPTGNDMLGFGLAPAFLIALEQTQDWEVTVLDEWFESEVKPRLRGEAYEIRFADDAILCFQHKEDAEKVLEVLPKRFEKYGLTLHPEKTRLIEFGRHAARNAGKQGKKPATFNFLGFVHICARSRQGKFTVHVKTIAKRLGRGLKAVWQWCKQHRHDPVSEQQKTLNAKLRGHYQYYGRPTNYRAIRQFYQRVLRIWREWLSRRTRAKPLTWERYAEILRQHPLLRPRITHAWVSTGSHA